MIVRNKLRSPLGHRPRGGVLLQKGDTVLDEATLTNNERATIRALAAKGVVEIVDEPPPSEARLKVVGVDLAAEGAESTSVSSPMKRRRARRSPAP